MDSSKGFYRSDRVSLSDEALLSEKGLLYSQVLGASSLSG